LGSGNLSAIKDGSPEVSTSIVVELQKALKNQEKEISFLKNQNLRAREEIERLLVVGNDENLPANSGLPEVNEGVWRDESLEDEEEDESLTLDDEQSKDVEPIWPEDLDKIQ
jgi:hypothetical protein